MCTHLGNALDKRDWRWHLTSAFSQRLRKYTFTAVHTKTHKRRFQIYPLWRAFSNLCVYGERFHRLRADGKPKRMKKFAFTSVNLRLQSSSCGRGLKPPIVLQRTAKKCRKIYNARAQLLFYSLNLLFSEVLVPVVVVVCLSSLIYSYSSTERVTLIFFKRRRVVSASEWTIVKWNAAFE